MYNIFYHSHAGSWAILIVLFLISYFVRKQKISVMMQRLFYIIMLVTGIGMLVMRNFELLFVVKGILAILLIGTMEMLTIRSRKGKTVAGIWVGFVVLLVLVVLIGYDKIVF
ncbi:MAG TPA: DUF1516 family protein [Bacillus sp. (in: firmicutes)]|uniref:DUF1516 family protein n=1 Tax=Bacillus litorisediminis TaxID=2922713 RepID=UPI001FACA21C|nr:DUF1516 family protein [Bacillus litorisediminis]HWO78290.1 DUF1516 family protein [Bacillus sp. (in: firmicutes)]